MNSSPVIVFDFETTGFPPDDGDRAIDIGACGISFSLIPQLSKISKKQVPSFMKAVAADCSQRR